MGIAVIIILILKNTFYFLKNKKGEKHMKTTGKKHIKTTNNTFEFSNDIDIEKLNDLLKLNNDLIESQKVLIEGQKELIEYLENAVENREKLITGYEEINNLKDKLIEGLRKKLDKFNKSDKKAEEKPVKKPVKRNVKRNVKKQSSEPTYALEHIYDLEFDED